MWRQWRAMQVAIYFPWPEKELEERTERAKRGLWVRWLIETGRLPGPTS